MTEPNSFIAIQEIKSSQLIWLNLNPKRDFYTITIPHDTKIQYFDDLESFIKYISSYKLSAPKISLLTSYGYTGENKVMQYMADIEQIKRIYLVIDDPPWARPNGIFRHPKARCVFNNIESVIQKLCTELSFNSLQASTSILSPRDREVSMDDSIIKKYNSFAAVEPHKMDREKNLSFLLCNIDSTAETSTLDKYCLLYTGTHDNQGRFQCFELGARNDCLVSQFQDIKSVRDIYLLDEERLYTDGNHAAPTHRYRKIRGNFLGLNPLLVRLRLYGSVHSLNIAHFNVLNARNQQESTKDLTIESTSFLWYQAMIDLLNQVPSFSELARSDFFEYVKSYCDSKALKKDITKWMKEYHSNKALELYTENTFWFNLINEALRKQSVNTVFKLRYYLNHLCCQLKEEHKSYTKVLKKCGSHSMTVYRGQRMGQIELKQICDNEQGIISMNSFISTSTNKEVALCFAGDGQKLDNDDERSVLFEIEIDINDCAKNRPFANVTKYSKHRDEDEVLFSIGSIFKIVSVRKLESDTWHIKLKLVNSKVEERVAKLLLRFRNQVDLMDTDTSELMWGCFFTEIGEYEVAEEFYERFIHHRPSHFLSNENTEYLSSVYNDLGFNYFQQHRYKKALQCYSTALTYVLARIPTWKLVSTGKHDFKTMYMRIDLNQRAVGPRAPYLQDEELVELATLYNNLVGVYHRMGEDQQALQFVEKAIRLENSCRHRDVSHKVELYNNSGMVQRSLGNYELALEHFTLALSWEAKSSSPNPINKVATYYNIALVYQDQHCWKEARENFELAMRLLSELLPENHPLMCELRTTIDALKNTAKAAVANAETVRVAVAAPVSVTVREQVPERERTRQYVINWHPPIRTGNATRIPQMRTRFR